MISLSFPCLIRRRSWLPVWMGLATAGLAGGGGPQARAEQAAGPGDARSAEELAANEQVAEIIRAGVGRGVLADDSEPLTPEQARQAFQVRPGFEIELVASEPEVRQPLYFSWDHRGRLWVVQYLQYQYPAGLKVVRYDQHLRAVFDRVPEPPPHGPRGADVITVLEDSNGDGRYDLVRDVLDGLSITTAVLPGRDEVWVLTPPYLLRYRADDDGFPAGDPEVHLRGFGLEDTHSVANSLQWGPDGWVYGVNGSTTTGDVVTRSGARTSFEGQCVWRYHPVSGVFEIWAEGGGNTFSLEIDAVGRVFHGTNGGRTRGMHQPQGGYGSKNWGKHGPLTNPHAYGWFEHMPAEGDERRFAQAFAIDEGGLETPLAGRIIAPNSLHNVVWVSRLEPMGSTFRTVDEEPLVTTDDRWFRPVWVQVGPDGAVYMADWYDTRLSHVSPVDDWRKDLGRIWRVVPEGGAPVVRFDFAAAGADELLEVLRGSDNRWMRRHASLWIGWRGLHETGETLRQWLAGDQGRPALDALLTLNLLDRWDAAAAEVALGHDDANVRRWAVRLLGDRPGAVEPLPRERLVRLAAEESDPEVLSQLASSARRWSFELALPVLEPLLQRDDLADDPHLPLLCWWAIEARSMTGAEALHDWLGSTPAWGGRIMREVVAPRLARRYLEAADGPVGSAHAGRLLAAAPDGEARAAVLEGVEQAAQGGRVDRLGDELAAALEAHLGEQPGSALALRIRRGDAEARAEALAELAANRGRPAERVRWVEALGADPDEATREQLMRLFDRGESPAMLHAVVAALSGYEDREIAVRLLDRYEARVRGDPALRERVFGVLASRPAWAQELLQRLQQWTVPIEDVPEHVAHQLRTHDHAGVAAAVEQLFPLPEVTDEALRGEIERVRQVVTTGDGAGDAAAGLEIYRQRCALCHVMDGDGGWIGPELTGYERANLDMWLLGIIDPGLEIREGYEAWLARTVDGRVLMGLMEHRDAGGIVLKDMAGQTTTVAHDEVESLEATPVSLMPPGLLNELTDAQLRDLFAYLMGE